MKDYQLEAKRGDAIYGIPSLGLYRYYKKDRYLPAQAARKAVCVSR